VSKVRLQLIGKRFGRLLVVAPAGTPLIGIQRMTAYFCRCDCGRELIVLTCNLRAKKQPTHSCGCSRKKHGMSRSAEYQTWKGMLQRCGNPKSQAYKDYGARGIKVIPRWAIFANFYKDMGPRPEGKSLDRVNNELGYRKSNCRWATQVEQVNNRRPSTDWTFEDEEEFY
jgi:hypothetical protein